MARPIKETPLLYSKESVQFLQQIAASVKVVLPRERVVEMLRNYNAVKRLGKV